MTEFEINQNAREAIAYGSIFNLFPYGLCKGKMDDKRLDESIKQTKGIVYDKWITKRELLIRAKFEVANKRYTTYFTTDHIGILAVGDTVIIIYWTENPELSKIKELEN